MAAVLGDFLRFTCTAVMFDQSVLNVFYYRVVSLTGFTNDGYLPLLQDFKLNVIDVVRLAVSSDYRLTEIHLQNVTNGVDFAVETYDSADGSGLQALPSLPSFVNYTFRLQRESVVTRNGYKRFAGVPESFVTGNEYVGSALLVSDIENALAADLTLGAVLVAEPVIMKRPLPTIVPPSHPYSSIGGSDFRGIGSQNTRKGGGWM